MKTTIFTTILIGTLHILPVPFLHANTPLPTNLPLAEKYYPQLEQILQLAHQNSPRMRVQAKRQQEFEQDLRIAKSPYWPRVNAGANYGYRIQEIVETGDQNDNQGGSFNIGANRPLYTWGRLTSQVERGKIDFAINSRKTLDSYQKIVNDLRTDYLELILKEMKKELLDLERSNAERSLAFDQSEFEQGRLSEDDYQTSLKLYEDTVLENDRLRFDQELIIRDFKRVSGLEQNIQVENYLPEIETGPLSSWLTKISQEPHRQWVVQHRDIQNQEASIDKERENYTIIKARQRPNVSTSANINQSFTNTSSADNVQVRNYSANINISWNVFDGFETSALKAKNRILRDRLSQELDDLRYDLLTKELDLRQNLLFSLRKLNSENRNLKLQKKIFNSKEKDFKTGLIAQSDFETVQLDFLTSREINHEQRVKVMNDIAAYLAHINQDPALDQYTSVQK